MLAAVGEQSDKPLVSSFLGAEGVPELLRVPDVAGSTAGRGSVPSYPAVEAAVRALARVVGYAVWLRTPDGAAASTRTRSTRRRRSGWSARCSPQTRRRRRPRPGAAGRPAGGVRHRPVGDDPGRRTLKEAQAAGAEAGLGRRAEGDRRPPARAPRPGARVAQHRHPRRDAGRLGVAQLPDHRPEHAGFVVQKNSPPGVPVAIAQHRGPAVRAGRVVRHLRAADRAARGQGVPDPAAAGRRRRRHGARDQVLADAVRLPRQRGRRRRRGRAS